VPLSCPNAARWLVVVALASSVGSGCGAQYEPGPSDPSWTRGTLPALALADELEGLIAEGRATEADRRSAHEAASKLEVKSAEDALGQAMLAGRLAQVEGLAAPGLVRQVERYARRSAQLDPTLRFGAAWRILGTLYVMAPSALVEHGDSEAGLELLERVTQKWPNHPENHLRLAEAYLALGDSDPAPPHLCFCYANRAKLRRDDRRLLDELMKEAAVAQCP